MIALPQPASLTLTALIRDIVGPVMEMHPLARLFFVPFIVVTSLTVLILFIALIVNPMQLLQAETNQPLRASVRRD